MEIPLKKVTVRQIIKSKNIGVKTQIKNKSFIGTEFYFLKEDMATPGFISSINNLGELKEIKGRVFEYLTDLDEYECSDEDVNYRLLGKDIIVLKTKIGDIGVNYNYYSYFKKFGVKLRFIGSVNPIGMFKDDEFVGILLPVRIKEEK
ncbi:hypothetical protein [Candidatus Clostridium stratigraminis]|uniref:Uncharacterized protein n=1 Tax=Candidatus Clostridium stratigraminis TaxID=3381661 RepID=A0ABW8T150_9CLOT